MLRTVQTLVNIVIGIFMLPFMISHLGEELYGIWILVGGFIATLHLMDFGFASAVTRFMVRNLTEKKYQSANEVISSAFVIYLVLGLLIALVTFFIAEISHVWVTDPLNVNMVYSVILIVGLALAVEFPFKSFAGVSIAYMRYDLNALSQILVKLLSTAITVWALFEGYDLIAVAWITLGSSILSNLIFYLIASHLFNEMSVSFNKVKYSKVKALAGFSFWAFLTDVSILLQKKLDIFMIGYFIGLSMLTVYYVSLRLVEYALTLLSKATGITMPVFTENFSNNDFEKLRDNVIIFIRINFLLGFYAVVISFLFGKSFINIWMGGEFDVTLAYYSLCILISGKIVLFIYGPLASALMSVYRHQWLSYIGFAELFLSAFFIFYTIGVLEKGILGASIGIVAPLFLTRFIVLPLIVQKEIGLGFLRIYKSLLTPVLYLIIATLICIQLKSYFLVDGGVLGYIILFFVVSMVYWFCALGSLTKKEWQHLFNILPRKISDSRYAKKFLNMVGK
ncbi:oligosaccharide flippase family protein [Marinobacter sp. bablab_jr008]|uniref:oligosaccharide flippase family protein n=1 Tax=Marinobacter sp. bablab_jr008 TaxID=2755064 RepID=UPI0018F1DE54|nr:oligosaccharide flippase family protein [Marinobacter sp. bablab_jr008]